MMNLTPPQDEEDWRAEHALFLDINAAILPLYTFLRDEVNSIYRRHDIFADYAEAMKFKETQINVPSTAEETELVARRVKRQAAAKKQALEIILTFQEGGTATVLYGEAKLRRGPGVQESKSKLLHEQFRIAGCIPDNWYKKSVPFLRRISCSNRGLDALRYQMILNHCCSE